MDNRKTGANFSPEVRKRAVRLVLEGGGDPGVQWESIGLIAAKIGCTHGPPPLRRRPWHAAAAARARRR